MDVLLAHHYLLVVCDLEHLHVVVMGNDQQSSAVILETDVIDPSAQAIDREHHLIHGVNILERPIVGVLLDLGLDDERVLGVAEAAGDDLDGEVCGADGE